MHSVVFIALLIGAANLPTEASFDESRIPSYCHNSRPTVSSQCLDQSLSGHMLKYGHSLEAIKRGLCDAYIAHFECIAEFICRYCTDYTIPGKTEYETGYRQDLAAHLESPSCAGIKVNYTLEKSYCDYLDGIEADDDVEDEEEMVTTEMMTTMASETPTTLDDITTESTTTMPTSIELDINNLTTAAALPADHSKKSANSAPVVGPLARIVVLMFIIPITIGLLAVWLINMCFNRKKQAEEVNEDIEMSKL